MAERRMTEVVPQANRFHEVLVWGDITSGLYAKTTAKLCNFECVRQPRTGYILKADLQYLSLSLQTAKCGAMNYSSLVNLES
jgi:hypothetical protein